MRRARTSGFTLVELMVTIAIVAILLAMGLPSFQGSFRSNRVATANNEFLATLALARTEAIRSTRSAGICGANAAGNDCVAAVEWNNGWLVWTNTNATAAYEPGTDTLVRYIQPRQGILLTVPASAAAANANSILFDNRGRALDTPADGRDIVLMSETCPQGNKLVRTLHLTSVGQVTSTPGDCP